MENRYAYDAFGNLLGQEEAFPNRILYAGQLYDQKTGQYYLRARYYNPTIGRFSQEDTYWGDGLNLYAYCANNPVRYFDPSGHQKKPNCPGTEGEAATDKQPGVEIETSYGKSSGKIGDFTELEGSTVDEILDRIPDEAVLRELYPVQGGATEGFEFKWVQNGQTYRVRVHNVDPSAPVGSNAYNGWVVRAQRGRRYFDPTINDFREAKYFNPNGPDYDEVIINDTHIPILDPYQN